MGKHHLMIGTWTPPGLIITVAFDDEKLTLELVKKTEIPKDEPISWMAFDVRLHTRPVTIQGPMAERKASEENSTSGRTSTVRV
jgi:carboxy-cis,cis-muconate cyclase